MNLFDRTKSKIAKISMTAEILKNDAEVQKLIVDQTDSVIMSYMPYLIMKLYHVHCTSIIVHLHFRCAMKM